MDSERGRRPLDEAKLLKQVAPTDVIGARTAKPRTVGESLQHGFDMSPAEDLGNAAREATQKAQGAVGRGERRKLERTPAEQETQKLFGQARQELGEDATSDQIMARVQELRPVDVAASADAYNKSQGRAAVKHEALEPDSRREEIADAFDKMAHSPNDPKVKKSYAALKDEVAKQWDYATKKMGITIEPTDTDPYHSEQELFDDVKQNKHLGVWRGGNPLEGGHPLVEVSPKTGENYNTMLRAVHDLFGHVAAENKFGEAGEESAWNLHKQMFSKEAMPAMTTETRGQTSWFFNNEAVRNGEPLGKFAQQKAGLLPEFANERTHAVVDHIKSDKPFAVLTAENPQNTRISEAANKQANDKLMGELRSEGYRPVAVEGHNQDVEGQKEHSFFVPDISPEEAARFGRKYKQTAVLTQEGLHDLNKDTVNPSENSKVMIGSEAAKQPYYSSVDGVPFSVPLDFSKEVLAGADTGFDTEAFGQENAADEKEYRQSLAAHEIATRQPFKNVTDPITSKKSKVSPPNDPARVSGLDALNEADNT